MRRSLSVIVILLCYISTFHAQSAELAKAKSLADEGNNAEAIRIYEEVHAGGESSADLMYNLGTLYLQEKQIAKSILFLERTIKYKPNHKEAKINLEIARSEINDPIFAITPFFLMNYWRKFINVLPMELWAVLSLAFLAAIVFMLYRILFTRMDKRKKWLGMAALLTGLFLCFAAAMTKFTSVQNDKYAIVMSEVDRLDGPDTNSKNAENPFISAGIKVKINDSYDAYYKVKLPDSDESWIKKENLEKI